jgi:hypothetical protein
MILGFDTRLLAFAPATPLLYHKKTAGINPAVLLSS